MKLLKIKDSSTKRLNIDTDLTSLSNMKTIKIDKYSKNNKQKIEVVKCARKKRRIQAKNKRIAKNILESDWNNFKTTLKHECNNQYC